ncbi:MAG: MotA/TolQ/ExbB proton channel family protein [Deltaproteobacteria bacterium]|nr:MAG: MotA/TolQ/ExbB proton channel family protein [Deltaproteobacteria bacterium]
MLWMLLHGLAYAADDGASGFTLAEIWDHSGWIARSVIVLLVVMFLATCIIFVERTVAFLRARSHSVQLALSIVRPMKAYDIDGALKMAQNDAYRVGHLTSVLRAGLTELKERPNPTGIHNAQRAIEKKSSEELAKLKRWFGILASVGSTSPFVGLAGTTFGVINAFQGMAAEGAGLAGVSAGISEALITTFVGIVVAILGVWAFNFFNGWAQKVDDELHTARADFLNWAEKYIADGGHRLDNTLEADTDAGEDSAEFIDGPGTVQNPSPAGK